MNLLYRRWLRSEALEPDLRKELLSMTLSEIEDAFHGYLNFGTAGIRGIMGAGTNRMNIYTVRRITEGLARCLSQRGEPVKEKGIVIAYDSRHGSFRFAAEAAGLLACRGFQVHLFPSIRPTPLLSFAIRHLQAAGGIMVTASHNPSEYNGCKLYNEDGAQLAPIEAREITRHLEDIEDELSLPVWSLEKGKEQGLIQVIDPEVDDSYTKKVFSLSLKGNNADNHRLRIIYTPFHGAGQPFVPLSLERLGFTQVWTVPEQSRPDPDFSTVDSPNPESKKAFNLAIQLGEQREADLIIGTDPDVDRLGLLVRNQKGKFIRINGNQIGVLLLQYLLEHRSKEGLLPSNGVILKSVVTTDLAQEIAAAYQIRTENTLTGFKYIAEKIKEYEISGRATFLFGFEESYGYLVGDFVRDKDAIQTAVLCCEMTAFYLKQNLTLPDVLNQLYRRFGVYEEDVYACSFPGQSGLEEARRLMDRLRYQPPGKIGSLPVTQVEDYQTGIGELPPSNLLKFHLAGGSWLAVRPSGTEPIIKFYVAIRSSKKRKTRSQFKQAKRWIKSLQKKGISITWVE